MPTVLRDGPYEVYFTSHDRGEPPHVHIDRDRLSAKNWLWPVRVAYNLGFSRHELRSVERLVSKHESQFLRQWHEYFGT